MAESITLYAAPIWAPMALKQQQNRRALDKAQRVLAIRITRGYRTVSTEALAVLARTVPWSLVAEERIEKFKARKRAIEETSGSEDGPFRTEADIQEETMEKWQKRWEGATTGRWTFACIPDLKKWCERKFGELTYFTAQMLTGHGNFQTYLARIEKAPSERCVLCTSQVSDDVEHTILRCPALEQERDRLTAASIPAVVGDMLRSEEDWRRITRTVDAIMRKKEELFREIARTLN